MQVRTNFLKAIIRLAYLFFLLIFANTSYSIEGMSDEERAFREENDLVVTAALDCVARNNLNIRVDDLSACEKEIEASNIQRLKFNNFYTKKDEDKRKIPHKERRKQYKALLKKYSPFTINELKVLHQQHCLTKWGSSATSECSVISESITIKKYSKITKARR